MNFAYPFTFDIQSREKEAVSFEYDVPMICTLFGAKSKLGICKVFVVNLLPIVFLSENWEQKHPEWLEIIEPIYKRTHLIQVEPQSLSLGLGLSHPDEVYAEKKGIKLAETLITFPEVYRPIWDRQKGMLI